MNARYLTNRIGIVWLISVLGMLQSIGNAQTDPRYTIFAYNELGMHCMNQDFKDLCILPPFNTMRTQVIDRSGEEPRIVEDSTSLRLVYSVPGNTSSFSKTNFWNYSGRLFGVNLPPDVGLTGNTLKGRLIPNAGDNDWIASGIPVTPVKDDGKSDPFQLALIRLVRKTDNVTLASTKAVIPVSWEINCNICHGDAATRPAVDILRDHDRLHGTQLMKHRPVLCASCHADPALGSTGTPGVSNFSSAMHLAHAPRMGAASLKNSCYACHPGVNQECQRDVHKTVGIECQDCHGGMTSVGNPLRTPWVSQPTCAQCHELINPDFAYEEPGKLFKESRGHGGVHCSACHGEQHAVGPAITAPDNFQAILKQGHTGPIDNCSVCHSRKPTEPFFHSLNDD